MRLLHCLAIAGAFGIATASPEPTADSLEKRVDCNVVNLALTVLKKLGPPATSFCSSYLKVPATKTLSTTTTTPTITVTTSTTTVTVTSPVCAPQKRRSPGELDNDRAHAERETDDAELDKRVNLPALSAFAAAKLSSGCSCLNLAPKTSITATVTAPTSTVNVVATTTACTVPVCIADGQRCDFNRPDLCCNQACCSNGNPQAPVCCSF